MTSLYMFMYRFLFTFQEEEIVKPKQAKRRKKAISDSDWYV